MAPPSAPPVAPAIIRRCSFSKIIHRVTEQVHFFKQSMGDALDMIGGTSLLCLVIQFNIQSEIGGLARQRLKDDSGGKGAKSTIENQFQI
jgi:hypothetical protein